jgi:uncharacterized membrane protein YadS
LPVWAWGTLGIVISGVVGAILFSLALAKRLGRPSSEGSLAGGAVGICGASVAPAIAAALPHTQENEKFTLLMVVGVTTLPTIAMLAYPLVVKLPGLDPTVAGIFIGGIHDVAQVVAASHAISRKTGDAAHLFQAMSCGV